MRRTITMDEAAKILHIGLCVLCGLPGAGKSTLAQRLKDRVTSFSVVIISYDDVLGDVAFKDQSVQYRDDSSQSENQGGKQTSLWRQHRQQLLQCLEHLIAALLTHSAIRPPDGQTGATWKPFIQCLESQGLISAGGDHINASSPVYFILDDNFYYQSMRYEVFQLARKYSLGFCQIFLHCPVNCCLQRNNKRQNRVLDRTIILMDAKLERPNPQKNPWEKDSLTLDSSSAINMDEFSSGIASLMNGALENPVLPSVDESEEKEKDRGICAANVIHQADQNLRRLISETMQRLKGSVSAKDMKLIAQKVQQLKCSALEQLRQRISGKTAEAATDAIARVQDGFRSEVDCISQQYLPKVQLECDTASPTAS